MTTTLTNRALLVSLSIRQWSARKYDKRETADLAARHGTAMDVARVNKSLLPGADKLTAVQQKSSEIRTLYYRHTLPWAQEGTQILKTEAYMDFTSLMRPHMAEWRTLVGEFLQEYPILQLQAQRSLGPLYRDEDYPEPETLAQRFDISLDFLPVPDAADWRVDVGDAELEYLRESITKQVMESQGKAMQEAWRRVYDVVSKAHERLSDPKAIFRDSLVENAVELCRLLPSLNITDDPALERTRQELERGLCHHRPETLRTAPDVREGAAKAMADIMSKMGAFYSQGA